MCSYCSLCCFLAFRMLLLFQLQTCWRSLRVIALSHRMMFHSRPSRQSWSRLQWSSVKFSQSWNQKLELSLPASVYQVLLWVLATKRVYQIDFVWISIQLLLSFVIVSCSMNAVMNERCVWYECYQKPSYSLPCSKKPTHFPNKKI